MFLSLIFTLIFVTEFSRCEFNRGNIRNELWKWIISLKEFFSSKYYYVEYSSKILFPRSPRKDSLVGKKLSQLTESIPEVGPCSGHSALVGDNCTCEADYYGDDCEIYCVGGRGDYNGTCVCRDHFVGNGCAFSICPFGDYDDVENTCACHSNAYSRHWYPQLNCDVLRPIRCRFRLIDFDSDCAYDKDDENNKVIFGDTHCRMMDTGSAITIKYWVECRMDATDITTDQPSGYMKTTGSADPNHLVVKSNDGVILNVSRNMQIDISVSAVNFGRVRNNRLPLHGETLTASQLAYTIDSTYNLVTDVQELSFTTPPLTEALVSPYMRAPFPDHPFTNRLFVEMSGKANITNMAVQPLVYGPESTTPILVVNSKWIYLDFPSLPLPPKAYKPLPAFTIVMIIVASVIGLFLVLCAAYYIFLWYRNWKDEREEREKDEQARTQRRENEMDEFGKSDEDNESEDGKEESDRGEDGLGMMNTNEDYRGDDGKSEEQILMYESKD